MAAAAGRKLVVKYDADGVGVGVPVVIAGARTDTFTIANEAIDITSKDDVGIQTLLDDIGKKSFAISMEGVLKDSTLFDLAQAAGEGTSLHAFEVDMIGLSTITGTWFINSFEVTGAEGTDPATFSCALMSSGDMTVV